MRCFTFIVAVWIGGLTLMGMGCSRSTVESANSGGGVPRPTAAPKNFILISIDTLRADHLSCYGYERPTSPGLDEYARSGAIFLHATSPSAWTAPSHLSVFTGLEAAAHQIMDFPKCQRLNPGHATMAKIFAKNGFRTAAFSGGGPMSKASGCNYGFEDFVVPQGRGQRNFQDNRKAVEEWLDQIQNERFFLCYHGFDVHKPYKAPPAYRQRFCEGYSGDFNVDDFQPGRPRPSEADLKYVIAQYDAEIAFVDEFLCKFLGRLENRGLLKDTLVLILSDHGDEFYEHGGVDHIHTLYDELVHVPWIMFGPGIPAVEVRDHVGTIDVLPTVLDLFGIKTDAPMQGVSRVPNLFASRKEPADAYIFSFTGFSEYPYHLRSVRSNRWKLVVYELAGMKDVVWGEERKRASMTYTYKFREDRQEDFVELFDLQADPGERRDVSAEHPEVVGELRAKIDERVAQSEKLRKGKAGHLSPEEEAAHLEQMKDLGYVGTEKEDEEDEEESEPDTPDGP